jgi:hypothetical protein
MIPVPTDAAPQRRELAVASASLYAPDGRRRWNWLSIHCPHCAQVHLGRVRAGTEPDGPRRMACGRLAVVVVREVT